MTSGPLTTASVALFIATLMALANGFTYVGGVCGVAFVGFVVAAIRFYRHEQQSKDVAPTLDLVFRSTHEPYLMERRRNDEQGEWLGRWFRVGVLTDRLAKIHVLLESCQPRSEFVFPLSALRIMDHPPETEYVDVHPSPEPSVFIDVFTQTIDERSGVPPDEMNLLHLGYVRPLSRLMPNQRQRLTLRVEGGGASRSRSFLIDFTPNGLATFTPD
jgi:hypothetical protein